MGQAGRERGGLFAKSVTRARELRPSPQDSYFATETV